MNIENLKVLTLNLDKIYFEQIKKGEKVEEYRECKPYWDKRLNSKEYDVIAIKLGYPKADDKSKVLYFKYEGFIIKNITHPKFNNIPVDVFAIQLKTPFVF